MKYNFYEIGKRIETARKETTKITPKGTIRRCSMEDICDKMVGDFSSKSIKRGKLSKIEHGDKDSFCSLTLGQFLAMCEIFNCDAGYLLGEYDYKTSGDKLICEKTGLWEENAKRLRKHSKETLFINALMSFHDANQLYFSFHDMLQKVFPYNENKKAMKRLDIEGRAKGADKDEINHRKNATQEEMWTQNGHISGDRQIIMDQINKLLIALNEGTAPCLERIDKEINGK